jgi:hypothetical protein
MRVLFEGGAEPTARNSFAHNLIVYGKLEAPANVGPNTRPETFTFARNYWFNRLDPTRSIPRLPAAEKGPAGGADPKLDKDFRPEPGGRAAGYGAHAAGLEKAWARHTGKFTWPWQQARKLQTPPQTKPAAQ